MIRAPKVRISHYHKIKSSGANHVLAHTELRYFQFAVLLIRRYYKQWSIFEICSFINFFLLVCATILGFNDGDDDDDNDEGWFIIEWRWNLVAARNIYLSYTVCPEILFHSINCSRLLHYALLFFFFAVFVHTRHLYSLLLLLYL